MNKKEKTIKNTGLKREKIKKEVKRNNPNSISSYNNSAINTRKCSNKPYNRK